MLSRKRSARLLSMHCNFLFCSLPATRKRGLRMKRRRSINVSFVLGFAMCKIPKKYVWTLFWSKMWRTVGLLVSVCCLVLTRHWRVWNIRFAEKSACCVLHVIRDDHRITLRSSHSRSGMYYLPSLLQLVHLNGIHDRSQGFSWSTPAPNKVRVNDPINTSTLL